MTRREELQRDIALHRKWIPIHEGKGKHFAADTVRKLLQIAEVNLKQLDEEEALL